MDLSIVTTLYKSSRYITEFHRRITTQAKGLTKSYEVIYVDDGSPDNSNEVVREICDNDAHVVLVELSRNFGHHKAMMCGISYAKGEKVFLIDVDLEESPETLQEFWHEMEKDHSIDYVVGETEVKIVPFASKITSNLFYKLFNLFSNIKISNRELVSRLMTRSYVNSLVAYNEKELFIPGIWADVGFKVKRVLANKIHNGDSSYTFRKKAQMAVDAITSFSNKPLIYIFYMGILISLSSMVFIVYLVVRKLFFGIIAQGFTSIMAALLFIGGIIIFSLGIIGIYVSKIYLEVKARPRTIVRQIYKQDSAA